MKTKQSAFSSIKLGWVVAIMAAAAGSTQGRDYSIGWFKVSGGGGTSMNGPFSLSGTIGQPDASSAMTGGPYSLSSGFWSVVTSVPTPGAPSLVISNSLNGIIVSWPVGGNYLLQQRANLTGSSDWVAAVYPVQTNAGLNSITLTSPSGCLFFRLKAQ